MNDLNYENVRETAECPMCGLPQGRYLGRLGINAWYRCAACGWDFPVEASTRKGLED